MLSLLPDEHIITQSHGGMVTLTNLRICYEVNEWSNTYSQVILLEDIISCDYYRSANTFLLVLAGAGVLCGLAGAVNGNGNVMGPSLIIAVLLVAFYHLTKRVFIIITSSATEIKIPVAGMKRESAWSLMNKIERARHKRVMSLHSPGT